MRHFFLFTPEAEKNGPPGGFSGRELPETALKGIRLLEKAGLEAYVTGGAVRDLLLGKTPGDLDLAALGPPDRIRAAFEGYPVLETGIRWGTVTVILDGIPLQVTAGRSDGTYSDGRRPDQVIFGAGLMEDLSRRDFTVNAMAYHPEKGIADFFGGREDLKKGLIRAVGDPDARFSEDGLRILRGLRFASVLGFSVEEETGRAIRRRKRLLGSVSAERAASEWRLLLCGKNAAAVLREFREVAEEILPELAYPGPSGGKLSVRAEERWGERLEVISALPPRFHLRMAALFSGPDGCGRPEKREKASGADPDARFRPAGPQDAGLCGEGSGESAEPPEDTCIKRARSAFARLKADNKTKKAAEQLLAYRQELKDPSETGVKKLMARMGEEAFFDLTALLRAETGARSSPAPPSIARFPGMPPEQGPTFREHFSGESGKPSAAGSTGAGIKRPRGFREAGEMEETETLAFRAEAAARKILKENQCFRLKDLAVSGKDLKASGIAEGPELGRLLEALLGEVMENALENSKEALLERVSRLRDAEKKRTEKITKNKK